MILYSDIDIAQANKKSNICLVRNQNYDGEHLELNTNINLISKRLSYVLVYMYVCNMYIIKVLVIERNSIMKLNT